MFLLTIGFCVVFNSAFSADVTSVTMIEDPWPPYTLGDAGKEPTGGIAVAFTKEIFKRIGVKADLKLYPWKRCLNLIKTGDRDGLMLLTKNAEREGYMVFTDPIMEDRDLIWYLADRPAVVWSDFKDLKGLKIGNSSGIHRDSITAMPLMLLLKNTALLSRWQKTIFRISRKC